MIRPPKHLEPAPTPYENFLYLLTEMDRAVQRGNIKWPADRADAILILLAKIARKVASEAGRRDPE
jgi:hypothetical protein